MKKNFWSACLLALALLVTPCCLVRAQEEGTQQEQGSSQSEADLNKQMRAIFELLNDEKYDEGLAKLSEVAQANPKDFRIGLTLVNVYQQLASELSSDNRDKANEYYLAGAKAARGLTGEIPPGADQLIGQAIYNEACVFGLKGDKAQAIASLKESFEKGFIDFELAASDKDFGSLLEDAEFKAVIAGAEKAINDKLVAEASSQISEFTSFPFELEATGTRDEKLSLAQYKGKVVIVDFWGTWCPPCRAEIPSFVKLKEKYGSDLEIIGLAYERGEDASENAKLVNDFATENKINYPCALGDEKTMAQIEDFQGYPTTLFIDRNGKVRMLTVGLEPYAKLQALTEILLKEKP